MSDFIQYIIYKFLTFLFRIIPDFCIKYFLILIAHLAIYLDGKHKKIVLKNLDIVFGDSLSKKEKSDILYESYKTLLFNMYEFIENQYLSKEDMFKKVVLENDEIITNAINNKRDIIFVTAHYGGWELAIPYLGLKYGNLSVVSRKLNNQMIHKIFIEARNKNNIELISKEEAARGMVKALRNHRYIAVAIDQSTHDGVEVDFFDTKVLATDSTSRLAIKFDAVIIPIFAVMIDFKKYVIKVVEPIDILKINFDDQRDKVSQLTQLQSDVVQKQIKELPKQWFWQHRRWKNSIDY